MSCSLCLVLKGYGKTYTFDKPCLWTDIDACIIIPCEKGATCIDLLACYNCSCSLGYTEKNCSLDNNLHLSQVHLRFSIKWILSTVYGKASFIKSFYLCLEKAMHFTNSGLFHEWYIETIDGINRNWSAKLANFLRYSESGMNCRFDEIINQSLKSFEPF